jgi:hypothetical protein
MKDWFHRYEYTVKYRIPEEHRITGPGYSAGLFQPQEQESNPTPGPDPRQPSSVYQNDVIFTNH